MTLLELTAGVCTVLLAVIVLLLNLYEILPALVVKSFDANQTTT